jgi:hypothetical protein
MSRLSQYIHMFDVLEFVCVIKWPTRFLDVRRDSGCCLAEALAEQPEVIASQPRIPSTLINSVKVSEAHHLTHKN